MNNKGNFHALGFCFRINSSSVRSVAQNSFAVKSDPLTGEFGTMLCNPFLFCPALSFCIPALRPALPPKTRYAPSKTQPNKPTTPSRIENKVLPCPTSEAPCSAQPPHKMPWQSAVKRETTEFFCRSLRRKSCVHKPSIAAK